jgi:membrane protease YdiL (CAAX protease family)
MKKIFSPEKKPITFMNVFFLICLVLRLIESLLIRTDQGSIGELFMHKIAGIALLAAVLPLLGMTWRDIGFRPEKIPHGILSGIALAGGAFIIAYGIEFIIVLMNGLSPRFEFYVSSYNIAGNTALQSGSLFLLICIIGNIFNVVMEDSVFRGFFLTLGERRFGFVKNNLYTGFLFAIWHAIMPLRNYLDGMQTLGGALLTALLFFVTSITFDFQLGTQYMMSRSLWDGMTVHFINNISVNLIHIVTASGRDGLQTLRVAIAQTIMFAAVIIIFLRGKNESAKNRLNLD